MGLKIRRLFFKKFFYLPQNTGQMKLHRMKTNYSSLINIYTHTATCQALLFGE